MVSNRNEFYQVKITMLDIYPLIWRRLLVPSWITFHKFHKVIQAAFDWQDDHMFLFEFKDFLIVDTEPDMPFHKVEKKPKRVKIDSIFKEYNEFIYEYDYGDSWRHEVVLEDRITFDEPLNHPKCIDGERHRPPEDVGGVGGYAAFLDIIKDPHHPDYEDMLLWAEKDTGGRKFDPDYFYKNEVNRKLKRVKC